jgi:hypothetical protein
MVQCLQTFLEKHRENNLILAVDKNKDKYSLNLEINQVKVHIQDHSLGSISLSLLIPRN